MQQEGQTVIIASGSAFAAIVASAGSGAVAQSRLLKSQSTPTIRRGQKEIIEQIRSARSKAREERTAAFLAVSNFLRTTGLKSAGGLP
jgi:hypothetical protein